MLSIPVLAGLIDANLAADGAVGPKRTTFSNALATGVVTYFTGKNFTTSDTGDGTGGTGTGIGIQALNDGNMTSIALGVMTSQGPKASTFMAAIMAAIKTHLESATQLDTTNPDVGVGTGTVNVGSFTINVSGLQAAIDSALQADGANGPRRSNLALAIATGVVTDVLATGTGTVTISGGSVIPPGTSGTGFGTIS